MDEKTDKSQLITLALEFEKYKTQPIPKFLRRKPYEPVNHKQITAFIPGTIRKVFVKDKKRVAKGEVLLVLDAMKMNNNILAPATYTVKKVHVKEGEQVAKNQLLIEFR